MEETDILNVDVRKQKRKKYIYIVTLTVAIVLALSIIIGFTVATTSAKAGGKSWVAPTTASQETDGESNVTESTTAPEIDIPEPTTGEVVESTKPSVPNTEETIPSEAPAAPERGDYPIDAPQTDRERLACVIYQEVGGNAHCDECRKRVGDVVLNRVNDPRFPDTIEGVLLQSGQYGRLSWTGIVWQNRAQYDSEKAAVERAYRIADELLAGNHSELYGNGYVWQAGFTQGSDGFWCCGHFFGR